MHFLGCNKFLVAQLSFYVIFIPSLVRADFADSIGFGHRAPSMGGAFVGLADDASSVYYNPAGLAQVRDIRLSLGIEYAGPSLWIEQKSGNREDYEAMEARGAMVEVAANLGQAFGYSQMSFITIGAGAYLPLDKVYETYVFQPEDRVFLRYKDSTQRYSLIVGMGISITSWLYAGGGLNLSAKVDAPAETYISDIPSSEANSGYGGELPLSVYIDGPRTMRLKSSPNIGLLCKLGSNVGMGISYRGELAIETMGKNTVYFRIQPFIDTELSRYDHLINFYAPPQISAGLSILIPGYSLLVSDLVWVQWSRFKDTQGNYPENRFHNTMVYRIGLEFIRFTPLMLRTGYSYDPSPVPDQEGESNFVDNDKHVITAGLGWSPGKGPLSINTYFQYHYLTERLTLKKDSDMEDYTSGGRFLAMGVGADYRF